MSNLDNLRALATISVFCHHLSHVYGVGIPFLGVYGGVFGIQLFFLLSGYLIIQSAQKYTLKTYVMHRLLRIFPAYLVIFISAGIYFNYITQAKIVAHPLGFVVNLLLLQHLFPTALMHFEVLHDSWTLTLELIWYAVAPCLVLPLVRRPNWVLITCLMLSSIWAAMADLKMLDGIYMAHAITDDNRYFYVHNAFPAQLCFFVIGAYIHIQKAQLIKIHSVIYLTVFMSLLYFLAHYSHHLTNPTFMSGIGIAALFILALKAPGWHFWPLKWIANISYSFYLLHLMVLLWVKYTWQWQDTKGMVAVLVVTLSLATLSHYVIEKPMMNVARKYFKAKT